jgi:hypothetical protein
LHSQIGDNTASVRNFGSYAPQIAWTLPHIAVLRNLMHFRANSYYITNSISASDPDEEGNSYPQLAIVRCVMKPRVDRNSKLNIYIRARPRYKVCCLSPISTAHTRFSHLSQNMMVDGNPNFVLTLSGELPLDANETDRVGPPGHFC